MISRPVYAKDTGYPWERRERGHHVRNLDTLWFVQKLFAQEEVSLQSKVVCSKGQQATEGRASWGVGGHPWEGCT